MSRPPRKTDKHSLPPFHFFPPLHFLGLTELREKLWAYTHQPVLNSTCASNKATTGAVAALQPLTLDLISPSCLSWRTTLMKPGPCWLLASFTKLCRCSFSSAGQEEEQTQTKRNVTVTGACCWIRPIAHLYCILRCLNCSNFSKFLVYFSAVMLINK